MGLMGFDGMPQAPTEAPQRPPPIGADVPTLEDEVSIFTMGLAII
jgi:hypothetical protein